ncbi:class I SAM-dependent methyltransferase [Sphingobium lignivorans]|uniref:SAM-dependent methyltransferase n=1 Tax=Sphingobium lignivorans TaxID=2735886 RepID=A0ABR6NKH5_9SPHN|nr:class I SAM-dependent methyltransferase [Sphingobium lignivorans]MBB5987621.1 SAM-dependent methyltransferase [Sphingobium lignivorans]
MLQFLGIFGLLYRRRSGAFGAYERHLDGMLRQNPLDRDLAFARAIGSDSVELFRLQGDGHVAVLREYGLRDGMAVFDLGCGCGRTAQALARSGWTGRYTGADVIPRFVAELKRKCPDYDAVVHHAPSIPAPDATLDLLFHWSVFTHVSPEECYLYMADTFRALRPGGRLIFSFMELTEPEHHRVFFSRVRRMQKVGALELPDTFLHRDWIRWWASDIGFGEPAFTDGTDASRHPPFWQSLVVMEKPLVPATEPHIGRPS